MILKFKKKYWIGISIALFLIILDVIYFLGTRWFYSFLVLSLSIGWVHFWRDFFKELKRQKEIELKFLEFARALVSSVKSGFSIPQAIINVSNKDYGALNSYVEKLKNKIEWGIPVQEALLMFSEDTGNVVIKRSVSIVIEAEKSGGNIENVLDAIVDSVLDVKKLKEERRATAFSHIIQGYIVFFIFIIIMLVLQLKLLPRLGGLSAGFQGLGSIGAGGIIGGGAGQLNLDKIFFSLVVIQGFFAGIMIGKFSEGTLKNGLLHSLILITVASLVIATVKGSLW